METYFGVAGETRTSVDNIIDVAVRPQQLCVRERDHVLDDRHILPLSELVLNTADACTDATIMSVHGSPVESQWI